MTSHYCLVGRDVSRSPSPAMMNAAFRSLGLDCEYIAVSIPEARFGKEFPKLIESGLDGLNVTIPFKSAVIPWLEGLDAVATRIQAVNTVTREEDGRHLGHNTDPDGIVGALQKAAASSDLRNALVIGAGGAARAFCEAMNRLGCVDIGVAVRSLGRSRSFAEEMEKAFPRLNLTLASMSDLHHLGHELIFNASPMGAGGEALPRELKRILPGTRVVLDAVYRPDATELLVAAAKAGAETIRGEEMLLYQGMAAFELWTGRPAPERPMRAAIEDSLKNSVRPRRAKG
jgi:shikimate dehydrogenase